jgi:hypothetical protein
MCHDPAQPSFTRPIQGLRPLPEIPGWAGGNVLRIQKQLVVTNLQEKLQF